MADREGFELSGWLPIFLILRDVFAEFGGGKKLQEHLLFRLDFRGSRSGSVVGRREEPARVTSLGCKHSGASGGGRRRIMRRPSGDPPDEEINEE
jgi:hypothetical protein